MKSRLITWRQRKLKLRSSGVFRTYIYLAIPSQSRIAKHTSDRYERGERNVALKNILRLTRALGTTPSNLMKGMN